MGVTAEPSASASAADNPAGLEPTRRVFVLRFEDGDLAGQVVRARRPTAAGQIDLTHAGDRPDVVESLPEADAADRLYRIFRAFAGALESWSLLDRGEPVPATLDGLLGQDFAHAVEMAYAWLDALGADKRAEDERAATEAQLQLPVEALG